MSEGASPLLAQYLEALRAAARLGPVLDLACGSGRNGLYLAGQGLPLVFADRNAQSLARVREAWVAGSVSEALPELWQVDLETGQGDPLASRSFGAALVFRYLHRPLMPDLKKAVIPGGLVVYETFTSEQPRYGRPTNPDYLLRPGELLEYFAGWSILHSFEGVVPNSEGDGQRAVASIVAQRPA